MGKFVTVVKHELLEMLPPTIFFFVILHIVALIHSLETRGTGISLPTSAAITLSAIVLGKSVLLANMLPFVNLFPEKPLIWNVVWRTVIYAVVALVVRYLEHLYDFWRKAPDFAQANQMLFAEINWAQFWAVQILLVTLISHYCLLVELARLIGRKKLMQMFFGSLHRKPAAPESTQSE
jgi:hypothetical protein